MEVTGLVATGRSISFRNPPNTSGFVVVTFRRYVYHRVSDSQEDPTPLDAGIGVLLEACCRNSRLGPLRGPWQYWTSTLYLLRQCLIISSLHLLGSEEPAHIWNSLLVAEAGFEPATFCL